MHLVGITDFLFDIFIVISIIYYKFYFCFLISVVLIIWAIGRHLNDSHDIGYLYTIYKYIF